jgi:predicted transcriptional regulator
MKTVQARLDADTEKKLAQLVKQMGVSPSMVVREGIRVLAACQPKTRKIAGLGKFASGISDLGSNKKHLAGFGR